MRTIILTILITASLCMAVGSVRPNSLDKKPALTVYSDTINVVSEANWDLMLPFFSSLPWHSYDTGFFVGPDKVIIYSKLSSEEMYKDFLLLVLKIRHSLE